jgi:hypothetical protein
MKWTYVLFIIGLCVGLFHPANIDFGVEMPEAVAFALPWAILFAVIGLIIDRLFSQTIRNSKKIKNCNYCKEEILIDAIKCKHCGSDILAETQSTAENYLHAEMYITEKYSGFNCLFFPNEECAIEIKPRTYRLYDSRKSLLQSIENYGYSEMFSSKGFLRKITIN